MYRKGKILATLALSVVVAGTVYGIKSHAGYSNNMKDVTAYATGLSDSTLEDKIWANENIVKINDVEDYYDFQENGATDANQYVNDTDSSVIELPKEGEQSEYKFKEAIDNSDSKYFPKIGDQGSIGSCVSWAMIYYQFSYTYNKQYDRDGKKNENTFSPMWGYDLAGPYTEKVSSLLTEMGAATVKDVPIITEYSGDRYENNSYATGEIWKNAAKNRITGLYQINTNIPAMKIDNNKSPYLDEIKAALNNGDLLTFCTDVYMWDFDKTIDYKLTDSNYKGTSNKKYKGQVITTDYNFIREKRGGHCMTIVGYDDNIWYDKNNDGIKDDNELGAFKIANSWGDWANNGFVWLMYSTLDYNKNNGFYEYDCHSMYDIRGFKINTNIAKQFYEVELQCQNTSDFNIELNAYDDNGYALQTYNPVYTKLFTRGISFTGQKERETGHMYFALDNVFSGVNSKITSDYEWNIKITNKTKTGSNDVVVKKVNIVDEEEGITYSQDVDKEFTLKNKEYKQVNVTTLNKKVMNTATVYYSQYDNPYIHYCVEGENWTSVPGVPMQQTDEYEDFTHKYVINLNDAKEVQVCFNDGRGSWDSQNGRNYSLNAGIYTVKDGKVTKIKDNDKKEFKVKLKADNYAPMMENNTIKLIADSVNGKDVLYRFGTLSNGSMRFLNSYSADNTYEFKLGSNEYYDFFVDAESDGAVVRSYLHNYTVKHLTIEGILVDTKGEQILGSTVNIKAEVKNVSETADKKAEYTYKVFLGSEETVLVTKEDNSADWIPEEEGTYTIRAMVSDATGQRVMRQIKYDLKEESNSLKITDLDISTFFPDNTIVMGGWNYAHIEAMGGKKPYKYSLGYINEDGKEEYVLENESNNYSDLPAPFRGNVKYFAIVTDATGLSVKRTFEKEVHGCEVTDVVPSVESPAKVGDTVYFDVKYNYFVSFMGEAITYYFEFYNNDTGNSWGMAADANYKDEHKWTFNEPGNYTIKLSFTTAASGLTTYSFDYLVKDDDTKLRINKILTNVESPALVGNSITFDVELSGGKTADSVSYKITNKDDNTETNLLYTKEDADKKATWIPQVKGTYEVLATATAGNKTATYTMEYVINENPDDLDMVTIFYNGFKTPYIHYRTDNSSWTSVPGMMMNNCDYFAGYTHVATISLNGAKELIACFNDGNNNWDSDNGRNYKFAAGRYTFNNGVIKTLNNNGNEENLDGKLVLYYSGYETPYIHYGIRNQWTNVPGVLMDRSDEEAGYTHKIIIDLQGSTTITACFNDGNNNWDSNNGSNYTFGEGTYFYKNGQISKK